MPLKTNSICVCALHWLRLHNGGKHFSLHMCNVFIALGIS